MGSQSEGVGRRRAEETAREENRRDQRRARVAVAAVICIPLILFVLLELPIILEGVYNWGAGATRAGMVIGVVIVLALCAWLIFGGRRGADSRR